MWLMTIPAGSAAWSLLNSAGLYSGPSMVISGQYNVLAVDIYKQVIGQLNFAMDAAVGMALPIPAVIRLYQGL
jgi:iron(III) transport system permease protein